MRSSWGSNWETRWVARSRQSCLGTLRNYLGRPRGLLVLLWEFKGLSFGLGRGSGGGNSICLYVQTIAKCEEWGALSILFVFPICSGRFWRWKMIVSLTFCCSGVSARGLCRDGLMAWLGYDTTGSTCLPGLAQWHLRALKPHGFRQPEKLAQVHTKMLMLIMKTHMLIQFKTLWNCIYLESTSDHALMSQNFGRNLTNDGKYFRFMIKQTWGLLTNLE